MTVASLVVVLFRIACLASSAVMARDGRDRPPPLLREWDDERDPERPLSPSPLPHPVDDCRGPFRLSIVDSIDREELWEADLLLWLSAPVEADSGLLLGVHDGRGEREDRVRLKRREDVTDTRSEGVPLPDVSVPMEEEDNWLRLLLTRPTLSCLVEPSDEIEPSADVKRRFRRAASADGDTPEWCDGLAARLRLSDAISPSTLEPQLRSVVALSTSRWPAAAAADAVARAIPSLLPLQ